MTMGSYKLNGKFLCLLALLAQARHMLQDGAGKDFAFVVLQHKLPGKIHQNAQAGGARVNHEVHAAQLAGLSSSPDSVKVCGKHRKNDPANGALCVESWRDGDGLQVITLSCQGTNSFCP